VIGGENNLAVDHHQAPIDQVGKPADTA